MKKSSFIGLGLALCIAAGAARLIPVQGTHASPRVSDGAIVQGLMKQFNVPGVGIAIIKTSRWPPPTRTASLTPRRARR